MTSGMRKAPPISTSSPRETITSRPCASAPMVSSTAAALLLTTVAASAPVRVHSSSSTSESRSPRPPVARSYSRLLGAAIRVMSRCSAASASTARPRLVWMTVPVRLNTGRIRGASRNSMRSARAVASASGAIFPLARSPASAPARSRSSRARASVATSVWPCAASSSGTPAARSRRSTEGRSWGRAFGPWTTDPPGAAIRRPRRRRSARRRRTAASGCGRCARSRHRPPAGRAPRWPGRRPPARPRGPSPSRPA